MFAIFREVTPLVEPLSLDEAYLDVTENAWGEALGLTVARRLKVEIRAATGLTASAGVAPNKFLAKIASGWKKPDGLTVIAPERVEPFLQKLPVDALWGVGPVTAQKLRARGIERLVDVRATDPASCARRSAASADWLRQLADGIDERPVVPNRAAKSSGSENTFSAGPDRHRRDPRRDRRDGARRGAAWLERSDADLPDGDDQGALLRLHDHHAQPLEDAGRRATRTTSPRARWRCSTGPRRGTGRSGCSASASTTWPMQAAEPTTSPRCRCSTATTRTMWTS